MLDDEKAIRAIDTGGMLSLQSKFPTMCEDAINLAKIFRFPSEVQVGGREIKYVKPDKIAVVGVGGSAIGGDLLTDLLENELKIPIMTIRGYWLPAWAKDARTLSFIVSYSGDTEETLGCLLQALESKSMIIAISSNGKLLHHCRRLGLPYLKVPEGIPPRMALPYLFLPMLVLLEKLGFTEKEADFKEALRVLRELKEEIEPKLPTDKNFAKQAALAIKDKVPVIYGFEHYRSVALRIKTQFNENSKVFAKCECFPELNHNEIVGFEGPPRLLERIAIILLRDRDESGEMKTRIDLTKELLSEKVKTVVEIHGRGKPKLSKMLSAIFIGDFISLYLALLYGVDPMPVEAILRLKTQMKERVKYADRVDEKLSKWQAKT